MRDLPAGTVTFLFTDIEGSTRLLHELGRDGYAAALAEHRQVVRGACERNGGVEVDTQGDAFFVAFPTAPGALAAATEAQAALVLPVRMGLHTGSPLLTDDGYVGTDVHRAARIAAAGHGGQVVVSAATAALIDGELRELGEHRLKDLTAPERLFQLGNRDFPPLRTLHRTNLPVPATPFVGRADELAQVRRLLERDDVRLLTLTGPGGSGKTRLGLQAAAAAAEAHRDGVWWVPLAPVADAGDVAATAARVLGGAPVLSAAVGERRLLLLLDNFEHVVDAATDVADLLAACPHANVLVTSRERLQVQSEHVYPVPVLAHADARELFVARARAGRPDFEPDALVDELCTRLDDLPLALELAAARTPLLTSRQLLDRLGSRLDLLRGGRDTETRHRTLRATIEWSCELMDTREQRLFEALSVFRGGWEIDAAERVCDADIDLLQSLVDKSLVRRRGSERFFMLETLREFAAERLAPEDREALLGRLLEHLVAEFETANLGAQATAPPRIELAQAERPNVDAVLAWAADADQTTAGLALMGHLELYWATNDPAGGRRHVDRLLAAAGEGIAPSTLAASLRVRGGTNAMTGQHDLAERDLVRAAEIFRSLGEEAEAAHVMHRLATGALQAGDSERATGLASDALTIDRQHGRRRDEASALNVLSQVAFIRGETDEGVRLGYEAAAVAKSVGFTWWHGVTLVQMAEHLLTAGNLDAAAEPLADGIQSLAAMDDRLNLPESVLAVAALAAARGDAARSGCSGAPPRRSRRRSPGAPRTRRSPSMSPALRRSAARRSKRLGRRAGRSRLQTRWSGRSTIWERPADRPARQRSDRNAVRISSANSWGCSQAAKWPPRSSRL